jgi:hypothetical protein
MSHVNPAVKELLAEFQDLFPESLPAGLPPYRGTQHVIDLDPAIPVKPGYNPRHSPKEKAAIEATILQLLQLGLIEESAHPFSAPVLLVEKKDGTLRMVVDYRRLNAATIKNNAPLPRLDETLDELAGAKYFTSLDLHSGYHQLRIADEDVPKTSFKTHMGQFYKRSKTGKDISCNYMCTIACGKVFPSVPELSSISRSRIPIIEHAVNHVTPRG